MSTPTVSAAAHKGGTKARKKALVGLNAPQVIATPTWDTSTLRGRVMTLLFKYWDMLPTLDPLVKEFTLYLCFTVFFSFIIFANRQDEYAYYFNLNLKNYFTEANVDAKVQPFATTLYDVDDVEKLWDWMQGPLLRNLFLDTLPGEKETGTARTHVLGYNIVLGAVRLRQIRVQNVCGRTPSGYEGLTNQCFPKYTTDVEAKDDFGPQNRYKWSNIGQNAVAYAYWGQVTRYSSTGYIVDLPLDHGLALAKLQSLQEDDFLDRATRALFTDFTMFNANLGTFITVRFLHEFLPGGGIVVSASFNSVRLYRYVTASDLFVGSLEIGFVVLLVLSVMSELRELRRVGLKTKLSDVWVYIDWLNYIVFVIVIAFRLRVESQLAGITVPVPNDIYQDFHEIAFLVRQTDNLNAINGFCIYFKALKFISRIPRMDQMFRTIRNASMDILLFLLLWVVVFFSFCAAFHLTFALEVYEYRTMTQSAYSLMQMLLGSFDFTALYNGNRLLAPVLFFSYIVLSVFILLNMFLAILNNSFAAIKAEDHDREFINPFKIMWWRFRISVQMFLYKHKIATEDPMLELDAAQQQQEESEAVSKTPSVIAPPTSSSPHSLGHSPGGYLATPAADRREMREIKELLNNLLEEHRRFAEPVSQPRISTHEPSSGNEGGAAPLSLVKSVLDLQNSVSVISSQMETIMDMRTELAMMVERLNALTEYFLYQPEETKTDHHIKIVSKKLDLLSEALSTHEALLVPASSTPYSATAPHTSRSFVSRDTDRLRPSSSDSAIKRAANLELHPGVPPSMAASPRFGM